MQDIIISTPPRITFPRINFHTSNLTLHLSITLYLQYLKFLNMYHKEINSIYFLYSTNFKRINFQPDKVYRYS